ncbi:hypothetical protein H310_12546 [Aphanomyces invadans]|uniref:Uncharacterized protein n=1 Tax=Aphanomyces invadans TaxID=157072 RepID=A0A024THH2_9STRA|nr:hypothetical protein H310_12546 [Aphanomyces invadans]ETV93503.1 hypothetical protein H310_12546 [Aphanomyces invadans]|eukprot:XP_008877845.1 hypothetical protein H310_12546 [Aphanomyces invadans]
MGNKALGRMAQSKRRPGATPRVTNQQSNHAIHTVEPFHDPTAHHHHPSAHTTSEVPPSTDGWRSTDTSELNNDPDDDEDDERTHPDVTRPRLGSGTKLTRNKGTSGGDSSDDDSDITRQLNTRNVTISSLRPPPPKPSIDHPPRPTSPLSTSGGKAVHLGPLDAKSAQSFARRKSMANQPLVAGVVPPPPAAGGMDAIGLLELVQPQADPAGTMLARGSPAENNTDDDDVATMELLNELMLESAPTPVTPKIESRKEANIREALLVSKQQRSAGKTTTIGGLSAKPVVYSPHLDATDEAIMNQILQERRPGTTPFS